MAFLRLRDQPTSGFDGYSFDAPPGYQGYPGPGGGDWGGGDAPFLTEEKGKPSTATAGYDPVGEGPQFNFPKVPGFTPPEFNAPTLQDAQNEPGYQFRLRAGSDALERSAAARGTLRTGGTLKDIMEYGQKFGSAEFGNVYDRALRTYGARYQAAKDKYAPSMAEWQLKGQGALQGGLAKYKAQQDKYRIDKPGSGGGGSGEIWDELPPEWGGFW